MLRTIIIDDEAHIRNTIARLLRLCCPEVEIVGEARGIKDGVREIRAHKPDLVFLDINLNDGNGYELLHMVQPVKFRVVFISAFDKNTIQAFKLSNLDYLMKPFDVAELTRIVKEAKTLETNHFDLMLEALEANLNS